MTQLPSPSIEARVKRVLAEETGIDSSLIKNDDNLQENLNLDSLERIEVMFKLEDEFSSLKLEITDEEGKSIETVQQAIDLVTSKQKDQLKDDHV